ncbi:unnamed protein product [Vitrella brassicaformis CCMP3155]|uniref:Cupin type-1 domain-containing protein n=1 Tax=Vitrella brassicaformis (strain CCMP3155) TaxID=1169540 RepID=A0A0G4EKJ2_VITBC|nr:unnamed protein product [Vitrella brassicaformis CCMP3155]|eukprot:CEL97077.1 unnamed protein product [Vitrella brassicaformis CCMP3155]
MASRVLLVSLLALSSVGLISAQAVTELERRASLPSKAFAYPTRKAEPVDAGAGGDVRPVRVQELPSLKGESISQVHYVLEPCGLNSPQLHPRAAEIVYVIKGDELEMGFVEENGPSPRVINNTLKAGQSMLVPEGLLHWQYNRGCKPVEFISTFNSEDPGVLTVASRLLSIPTNALATTLGVRQREAVRLDSDQKQVAAPAIGGYECLKRCGIDIGEQLCKGYSCGDGGVCMVKFDRPECVCAPNYVRDASTGKCVKRNFS